MTLEIMKFQTMNLGITLISMDRDAKHRLLLSTLVLEKLLHRKLAVKMKV